MFHLSKRMKLIVLFGFLLFVGTSLSVYGQIPRAKPGEDSSKGKTIGGESSKGKKFVQKDCLDCHKKFADKYLGLKNVHAVVKQKKCEDCHLRHGLVPKLILKKEGNEVCYPCHTKEKIGLNKPNVHTALKRSKCIACHNPHASQAAHLLKAEGSEACFQCHKKENFEKKAVHKVGPKGCTTCHSSHSSDQKDLLVKAETPLCLSCHDSSKAPFRKAHGDYPVSKALCTGCHNPHS